MNTDHPGAPDGRSAGERRANPALRARVEDMLTSIRSAANQEVWTAEERARHEATMARIMEQVREHALSRGRTRVSADHESRTSVTDKTGG